MVEKTILLTGTSANGIEDAVSLAVKRAALTIQKIHSAKVLEAIALVENGELARWRVKVVITFAIDESVHE